MSTRTAIFKEQDNGTFRGVYCHHDGYLEGVGNTLLQYYQNPEKTQKLIDEKRALSSIGQEPEIKLSYSEEKGWLSDIDFERYCTAVRLIEYEQYFAKTLDELQRLNYLTVDENDKIQGFVKEDNFGGKIFTPYRGSDNNGFIYVQMLNGRWLVSIFQKKFKTLKVKS